MLKRNAPVMVVLAFLIDYYSAYDRNNIIRRIFKPRQGSLTMNFNPFMNDRDFSLQIIINISGSDAFSKLSQKNYMCLGL